MTFEQPKTQQDLPIIETETSVSYLGVKLEKAKNRINAPQKSQYENYINDAFSLELQKKIAVAWAQGEPVLIEGGTSIGKTTTAKKMSADTGYEVHYANLNGATDVEDLMGRYIPNPHKKSDRDPDYIFADGKVTSGLRVEEGKIKVVILDEYNSASPNILIRLHEVLDALERNGSVTLSEDASEVVPVNRMKTKIIALTNTPGKGYLQREPLDPAQLRRWVYIKEENTLPQDSLVFATESLFGINEKGKTNFGNKVLESRDAALDLEQLSQIAGVKELTKQYLEFHRGANDLVTKRMIGKDQPQKFFFDDREEPRRVRDFVMHFYRGDITETFQEALRYFYVNKILDPAEKQKLEELISHIRYVPPVGTTKRKGLDPDAQTPDATSSSSTEKKIQLREAIKIMGNESFFGPKEVEETFEVKLATLPPIPFTKLELERAKELNQSLVLYVDKASDGSPLTAKRIKEYLGNKTSEATPLVKHEWFEKDAVAQLEVPRLGWRLSGKEVIKNSPDKNYIQQTEELVTYIKTEVFKGGPVPSVYQDAIDEFESVKGALAGPLVSDDDAEWNPAVEKLSKLKINQMCRENFAEVIYRMALHEKKTKEHLLEDMYIWSSSRDSDGNGIYLGHFDLMTGIDVLPARPQVNPMLAICFSRNA
ncbi:AAA family ATPase [Candidatus Woesebacteria bacterium]|nr:AAA family ATPase [Candidatus Woesebacteria bacterium]